MTKFQPIQKFFMKNMMGNYLYQNRRAYSYPHSVIQAIRKGNVYMPMPQTQTAKMSFVAVLFSWIFCSLSHQTRNMFKFLFAFFFLLLFFVNIQAQVSGKVFKDYNNNGTQGTAAPNLEPGVPGVVVNAYNSADVLIASYTSDAAGAYTIPASGTAYNGTIGSNTGFAALNTPLRIEFIVPNTTTLGSNTYQGFTAPSGSANASSVQFVTAGPSATNISLAINKPADYTDANPKVGYAIMVEGNQMLGAHKDRGILFNMTYSQGNVNGNDSTGKFIYTTAKNLGTTFGLAHQRSANSMYAAAFMKRHAGFGPGGTGAIYKINTTTNAISTFLDFNTLYGSGFAGIDPHPTNTSVNSWDKDSASWDNVGKISFGDIDISEDEQTLWVISLTDRKLYKMPLGSATNPVAPTAAQITKYPTTGDLTSLPGLVGTNLASDIRPFGLGIRNGLIYIGLVHSAQTSGLTSELRAFVYEFNPNTAVFTKVLDFPLDYQRGRAVTQNNGVFASANWQPWKTNFTVSAPIYQNEFAVPQPILSDINFVEGKMVLGFKDRFGDQMGYLALDPVGNNNGGSMYCGDAAGELLFACKDVSGNWQMESNSSSVPAGGFGPTLGAGTNQGPGGGEFVYTDRFPVSQTGYTGANYILHDEVALGGVANIPGSNEIVTTIFDPVDNINTAFDGGIAWYNMADGSRKRAFWAYDGGSSTTPFFGKANAMGDIEILSAPAPIEIGNRVWNDADKDGVQDAGEAGIGNVTVALYADFNNDNVPDGAALATTNTSNAASTRGSWYFNASNVTDGDPVTSGNQAGLVQYKKYLVSIASSDWSSTIGIGDLLDMSLTTANSISGAGVADQIDNDATLQNNFPRIGVTLGMAGQNDHSLDFGFWSPTVNIYNTIVSPCYWNGTASVANVTVSVTWTSAPPTDQNIEIIVGGVTKTIPTTTGSSGSQSVVFVVSANGTTGNSILVRFATSTAINNSGTYNAPAACTPPPPTACAAGQLGGMVWQDYNENGIQDTYETIGVQGLTVTVFTNSGTSFTTTTDSYGKYVFTQTLTYPVRIEFTNIPAGMAPTFNGTNSHTTVQFISAATCAANLGLNYPSDYCQNDPNVATPIYYNGIVGTSDAIRRFPYTATGTNWSLLTPLAATQQIGSAWGMAYAKKSQKLYTSAFLKRHVALKDNNADGTGDLGAIYVKDSVNKTVPLVPTSLWLDVANPAGLNINVGTSLIPTEAIRNLGGLYSPSCDSVVYNLVGKVGLGGIDLSESDSILYFVNLLDKKLYAIYTHNKALVSGYPIAIPNPCNVTKGSYRPFAVKVYRGKPYVGVICDAEISQSTADLSASVYRLDGGTFTQITSFPLNYKKGMTDSGITPNDTRWNPWSNAWPLSAWGEIVYPQPLLSDIEFDTDGSMVLGFIDRFGHQGGIANYSNMCSDWSQYTAISGGDILRVYNNNGTSYIVENNGKVGAKSGCGVGNMQGLGGGEFYCRDDYAPWHEEKTLGSLMLLPGRNEVATTAFDPLIDFNIGGLLWFSNTDGTLNKGYEVFNTNFDGGTFAKANGMGDIEAFCNPAPLQIGNYVWADANRNGVQDPSEAGVQNVVVRLYNSAGTLVASTTTNASGEYYFNDYFPFDTLQPAANYYIIFGPSQYNSTTDIINVGTNYYQISPAGGTVGSTATNDLHDSDPIEGTGFTGGLSVLNGQLYIPITIGQAGSINHTYDLGIMPQGSVGNYVWNDLNSNGLNDELAGAGINGITVQLWNNTTSTLVSTTTTANDANGNPGYYNFVISTNGNYYVKFPTSNNGRVLTTQTVTAGTDNNSDANTTTGNSPVFTINITGTGVAKDNPTIDAGFKCTLVATIAKSNDLSCLVPTATLTASPASGVAYAWNDGNTNMSRSVSAAGTYSVIVTDLTNLCTATASVNVTSTISNPPCVPITIIKTK